MSKTEKKAKALTPAREATDAVIVKEVVSQPEVIKTTGAEASQPQVVPVTAEKPVGVEKAKTPPDFKKIKNGVYEINTLAPRILHLRALTKDEGGKRVKGCIEIKFFDPTPAEGGDSLLKVLYLGVNPEKHTPWVTESHDFNPKEPPYSNIERC